MLRAETLTHNLSHAHARTLMCALRTMAAARWLRRRRLQRDSLWILDWWPWWPRRLRQGIILKRERSSDRIIHAQSGASGGPIVEAQRGRLWEIDNGIECCTDC